MSSKREIREEMLRRLAGLSSRDKREASEKLCRRITDSSDFRHADALFAFYPYQGEIDILPLLQDALDQGKALCLPRVEGKEMVFRCLSSLDRDNLESNRWGLTEPNRRCPIKGSGDFACPVMVVPGTAFTAGGKRLGRGGGYYDRYLAGDHNFCLIGVGYSCQQIDELPLEPHDIAMDRILCPS